MKKIGTIENNIDRIEAASDMLGAVMMVSLVVGFGVVNIGIIGQDIQVEIPSLSMIPDTNETDLFLYHTGGESLKRGEFLVRIDGEDYYSDDIYIICPGGEIIDDWDSWDLGEMLDIEDKSNYHQILILSTKGRGANIIAGSATGTALDTKNPAREPVDAKFTADIRTGTAPLTVQFYDKSTGSPNNWHWDFDGGISDGVQNPVYTYMDEGTYTVILTASNSDSSEVEEKTDYITVTSLLPLVADFEYIHKLHRDWLFPFYRTKFIDTSTESIIQGNGTLTMEPNLQNRILLMNFK